MWERGEIWKILNFEFWKTEDRRQKTEEKRRKRKRKH
jgi:hypothetical protein